jgi:muramoyltetrapeptide carboxypeptidase
VALVAPASPFDRDEFLAGVAEIERLGFEPVYDEGIFDRLGFVAGPARHRADALMAAWQRADVDAIVAVRGGYGSVETLPFLDRERVARARTAFVGYSDLTSIHAFLNTHAGLVSIHGPMIEGRLAKGPAGYDAASLLKTLGPEPAGPLPADRLEVVCGGEARGPLAGGTLTQLLASFGTPFEFQPPPGHVLFIDEVGERPYRLHRMLTQWRLAGRFARAAAVIVGQLPRCDEPGGAPTGASVIRDVLADFHGPVMMGFPSGHTTTPFVTLPFGVDALVTTHGTPRVEVLEAAAGE